MRKATSREDKIGTWIQRKLEMAVDVRNHKHLLLDHGGDGEGTTTSLSRESIGSISQHDDNKIE